MMEAKLLLSLCALLTVPTPGARNIPSVDRQRIEEYLSTLKREWKSTFESNYELFPHTDINDFCGNFALDSLPGCQEISLQGTGRVVLYSAEDGRYYREDMVCFTLLKMWRYI